MTAMMSKVPQQKHKQSAGTKKLILPMWADSLYCLPLSSF